MPRISLAKVATQALKRELQRRLEALPKLIAERDELNRQITEIETAAVAEKPIAQATRLVPRKPRATAKTTISLPEALVHVMSGKESVTIPEAVEGVMAAGYKSTSKNFSKMLGMTLATDDRFERVSRGQYRVKG